jgi:serine/threonine protein kinase/pSer/pThr/pTyr-binding forkhead associated (FHA) protein
MPFTVGDLIDGHYRVEKRYAGGMGFVYIVLDEVVGKRFAIKQLPDFQAENRVLAERFRREASAWLLLDYHPNIVQAHSFHPRPDGPILILEFVDGPGLDRLLKLEKRLAPVQVVRYARQFCQGMNYAHSKPMPDRGVGVLHRDIKPGNILITRANQVKVTDFGLAKFEENPTKLTGDGQFVGTIAYSSPEQLRSAGKVTKASDVYSLGAVMYQSLAGQPPFRAAAAPELYRLITQTVPLPLSELCPDLDAGLAGIVLRCLEKNASARFADFSELDKALAGLEFLLRDRRDWACATCGYTSRNQPVQCPVCEVVVPGGAAAPDTAGTGWSCGCGMRVNYAERSCPRCGRSRGTTLAPADEDAALPVSGDLVPLPSAEEGSASSTPLKPSDTAWPGAVPSATGDSKAAPSPSDSNLAVAVTAPAPAQAKRVWDPASKTPSLLELGPRAKLLSWTLERSHYTVGRDTQMRIRLKDSAVAGYQLFLVRLGNRWLALNRQPGTVVEFNGWKADQRLLKPGDLIHVGATWLAFAGPAGTQVSATPIPGRWPDRVGPAMQTIRSGGSASTSIQSPRTTIAVLELPDGREFTSRGEALRIGSSPLCDVRIADPSVLPVHALIAWQLDGLHLINVSGTTLTLGDGRHVTDHTLAVGDAFRIGESLVHFRMDGDPTAPGRLRAADELTNPPRMALTIAAGPQKGQSGTLPTGEPATLGRHSECDYCIASDPYMSRRHLELTARAGTVEVKDLGSRHGFAIGQTNHTDTAQARIGDVIRVGQSYLLVHQEIPD